LSTIQLQGQGDQAEIIKQLQTLFDGTFQDRPDRLTSGHTPRSLLVHDVVCPPSRAAFSQYQSQRTQIRKRLRDNPAQAFPVSTDGFTVGGWQPGEGPINEKLLFTGTVPSLANAQLLSRVRVPTDNEVVHGALYGQVASFAESVTKADQYAKANADGLYPMLISLVLLGNVKTVGVQDPQQRFPSDTLKAELRRSISPNGQQYHSLCGDRRNPPTGCQPGYFHYREFFLYEEQQSMPVLLVWYKRVGEDTPNCERSGWTLTDEEEGHLR